MYSIAWMVGVWRRYQEICLRMMIFTTTIIMSENSRACEKFSFSLYAYAFL
jgi:hypothetical protein